jgi:hypothetical protein
MVSPPTISKLHTRQTAYDLFDRLQAERVIHAVAPEIQSLFGARDSRRADMGAHFAVTEAPSSITGIAPEPFYAERRNTVCTSNSMAGSAHERRCRLLRSGPVRAGRS